jgi:hypothetical protein
VKDLILEVAPVVLLSLLPTTVANLLLLLPRMARVAIRLTSPRVMMEDWLFGYVCRVFLFFSLPR